MVAYEWLKRRGDGEVPGKQDFREAHFFLMDKITDAYAPLTTEQRQHITLQDKRIQPWLLGNKAVLFVSVEHDDLAERWNEMLDWFDDIDDEKAAHSLRETKGFVGTLYWGCWRQALGVACGLEGIKEFRVQQTVDDSCPVWGTRHVYRDSDAPGGDGE